MIVSDFTEVALIDEEITKLQSELTNLYARRSSILRPSTRTKSTTLSRIDFTSIDMSLDEPTSLTPVSRRGKK